SNVTGQSSVGGVNQPIISQLRAEQTIRLNDGEINLMGGILENTETLAVEGWPFLSSIPIFKYLFSRESKEKITNEIVFLLVPLIARGKGSTDMNRLSLDFGPGPSFALRFAARPGAPTDTARAASGSPPQPAPSAAFPPATSPAAIQPAAIPPVA